MTLAHIMLATAPHVVGLLGAACITLLLVTDRPRSDRWVKKIEDLIREL